MSFNAQVVEVLDSQPLTEGSDTQVDNLRGLYRLTTADNAVVYAQSEKTGWDRDLTGSVLGAGCSVLLWFGARSKLSYYATASTLAVARLEKVRLVPDEEIEKGDA